MTQTELDIFITNSQCCLATKTAEYIIAKNNGEINTEQLYYEWMQLNVLIFSLSEYDITSTCMTEDEICYIIELIKRMCAQCGC